MFAAKAQTKKERVDNMRRQRVSKALIGGRQVNLARRINTRRLGIKSSWFFLLLAVLAIYGCYPSLRKTAETPPEALRKVRFFLPTFEDDLDFAFLKQAIERNLEYLERLDKEKIFIYGEDRYTCGQVIETHKALLDIISKHPSKKQLNREIRKHFLVYRATGRVGNRHVLFTGYFLPVFEARLKPDDTFKYPIYRKPNDLVRIDLSPFGEEFRGKSIIARVNGKKVVPYYSREEIDIRKALAGRGLEIAWLKDPVDVDFLQIQGSGLLKLKDGSSIRVGYAAKNGRPYYSIGKYLIEKGYVKKEEMSMQRIRKCLKEHPEIVQEVLNKDASYVFFRILGKGHIVGHINVPLTPGRSLALDSRLFPEGALAFVSSKKPVLDNSGNISRWTDFSRFMVFQDTGGAIRGAGRADLFWGSGTYAELAAGYMRHDGDLYLLIKKR